MSNYNKPGPGKLISLRGREWMVLPSADEDVLMVRPLGGTDDEVTGIYMPLAAPEDRWEEAVFPEPGEDDINDFETARLLFDASRLSFRNVAGPFRCMGKLSFRPRSYQIVPLVMALRQPLTRLLIADDVGIGKTIEALIILKEMMERGEIRRFAVICQPHLCEQWQGELKDKLDIEAEIIRSSTVSALERKLIGPESVFHQIPYQVVSIDYVKSDRRKPIFLNDCPEFIIVDEAHTCAMPRGASSVSQQQRYHLLHDIVRTRNPHLLMLTATPHSGKDEEFRSLLGLVNPEFEGYDMDSLDQNRRRKIARHFIQRKRENIKRWLGEETPFPERETRELPYRLSADYLAFFHEAQSFARDLTRGAEKERGAKGKYWAALALLRGIMSSPAAGMEMLQSRIERRLEEQAGDEVTALRENPVIERIEEDSDAVPAELFSQAGLTIPETERLRALHGRLEELAAKGKDRKSATAISLAREWLDQGCSPIIFCRFIATAKYLGELLKKHMPSGIEVQVITSELPDEQRREKIETMGAARKRLLVATDCLSEGINLQDHFNAVMHYDLPWNPNRLEQREGRVDRFGQRSPLVRAALIWGEDNPIDAIVLKVLIRKVQDIKRATGVSISLGDDNRSVMDAVLREILIEPEKAREATQMALDFGEEYRDALLTGEIENAKKRAENLRSIFAHESIRPEEIEADLKAVDEAIGDIGSVEHLVINGIRHLGGEVQQNGNGCKAFVQNLPGHLKELLPGRNGVPVSFVSPTPEGYHYIGRNHRFTEQLCQFLLALAFEQKNGYGRVARASVIQTGQVTTRTTIVQFRVRNVIKEVQSKLENISEEMYLWGFEGSMNGGRQLDYSQCKKLLYEAASEKQLTIERQRAELQSQMQAFENIRDRFITLAEGRAEALVEAHGRFKSLVGGRRYEAVYPVLPPDILGVYVFIPQPPQP